MKKSISTRLLIITLSASIVGMGLIAAVSMFMSSASLRQESLGKISQNTATEAMRINGWVENQTNYISSFATDLSQQPNLTRESQLPALEAHNAANTQYFDVYIGYPDGTGTFASGWVPDYAGGWTSYKRGWYTGAAENPNQPFITSLYTDAQTGSLCVTVSKVVVSSGEVAGVAAADMFIDVLADIVNKTSVGQDSYAFMTDASGNLLIHPNPDYGPDKDDNFQNLTKIENGLYKELWEKTSQSGETYKFESKDGVERYYTMQEISVTGWRLYTAISASVVNEPVNRLFYTVIPIFAVVLILAAFLIFYTIKRQIVKPINDITGAARELANGDTDIRLSGKYEGELKQLRDSFVEMADNIRVQVESTSQLAAGNLTVSVPVRSQNDVMGNALNQLCENLNHIMESIKQASARVSNDADQISNHSQMLAQGATEQAAAVEQLSSSINEIAEKIRFNQEKTGLATEVSERIDKNAHGGMELMDQMLVAVTEINDASSSISMVIKAIEDIAFQTNILALNAAVEAARAGQHGKGFAVVADEVRNLASKSAAAAKESGDLIRNSIDKASEGARIAQETSRALETVISGIGESSKLIGQISSASNEEFAAISNINEGINQVSQVVNSNAATSEETAAAAQELSTESDKLRKAVGNFTLREAREVAHEQSPRSETHSAATSTGFSLGDKY